MEPAFESFADKERTSYVDFFRESIAAMRAKPSFVTELLIQPNGRQTPAPFCLMRVDGIYGGPTAPKIVRFAAPDSRSPIRRDFVIDGLALRVEEFSWESLTIRFGSGSFQIESLRPWLDLWLDPHEHKSPDKDGLSGVVHDLAWTQRGDSTLELCVDLGSAPTQALREILAAIRHSGITECIMSRGDRNVTDDA